MLWGLLLIYGCAQNETRPVEVSSSKESVESSHPVSLSELQQENQKLTQQVKTLVGLPKGVSLQDLYAVERVLLGKYTGLYDKDRNGDYETLSVYIRPLDRDGDTIKAAGEVDVQLWDLSGDGSEALIREWHISAETLRTRWFSTLMAANYRLSFELPPDLLDTQSALTVRIRFLDYLTGQVFTDQMAVKSH